MLELYNDTSYAIESTSAWAREHAEILGVPFEPRSFDSLAEPIVRAQWLVTAERATQVLPEILPGLEVGQSGSPLMPDTRFIGMTREGVSKGSAIRAIATAYEIALEDVMYVGDAGNDLPALKVVGHPVAMGNADLAVRAAAAHTVADVEDAGLAQALELARVG